MHVGRWRSVVVPVTILAIAVAACGGDDDDGAGSTSPPPSSAAASDTTGSGSAAPAPAASGATLKVGYSAWPGWFPLAVAEDQGIFEQAGVDVELTFFADYIASLDALVAGGIDVNTQTLNDTIFGVAAGSEQRIFLTNDNSTGNDAVICDASIASVEDLAGKSIAAEPGVVDHFLLLQGLADAGLSEADIEFQGLPTASAVATRWSEMAPGKSAELNSTAEPSRSRACTVNGANTATQSNWPPENAAAAASVLTPWKLMSDSVMLFVARPCSSRK